MKDMLKNPVRVEEFLELILSALNDLIEYELAVILKIKSNSVLEVQKAMGPLSTNDLSEYTISLKEREDIAELIKKGKPYLFKEDEKHKEYSYAMIGYAYEQLENHLKAKENYSTALEYNEYCSQAIEGLANVYFKEKNHYCTYKYVMRAINNKQEINFNVPKPIKYVYKAGSLVPLDIYLR